MYEKCLYLFSHILNILYKRKLRVLNIQIVIYAHRFKFSRLKYAKINGFLGGGGGINTITSP